MIGIAKSFRNKAPRRSWVRRTTDSRQITSASETLNALVSIQTYAQKMSERVALIAELEAVLAVRPMNWRASALRRLTALFLATESKLGADQVAIYDLVFPRLIAGADGSIVKDVSEQLARSENAPPATIDLLAKHQEPTISLAVLKHAAKISEACLIDLASTRSSETLLTIASRNALSEAVSDEVIGRRDKNAIRALFSNSGAKISDIGFVQMIDEANADASLRKAICARPDIPEELRPFFEMPEK